MSDNQVTIIKPNKKINLIKSLTEMWEYRDLFLVLVNRDVRVKYKQTALGVGWVVFQPLIATAIFTLLFSRLIGFSTGELPYSVFAFVGLVYWTYFSNAVNNSSSSLVLSEIILKKVYFPRLIIPFASIVASSLDFFVSVGLLFLFLIFFKISISLSFISVVLISFIISTLTIAGLGAFFSAINVKFRDVRFVLPFFIQLLVFLTPVFYPLDIISPSKRWILAINPLTTVIEASRAILSSSEKINQTNIWFSLGVSLAIFFFGIWYFKKAETTFSDVV